MRLARGGGPMPLTIPVQQERARKTSASLFPKNSVSHLLRGACQVVRIGKEEYKMAMAKKQRRENPVKIE